MRIIGEIRQNGPESIMWKYAVECRKSQSN